MKLTAKRLDVIASALASKLADDLDASEEHSKADFQSALEWVFEQQRKRQKATK